MARNALRHPTTDPTHIFELFRGSYGSELLTAAVTHFDLFGQLERRPMSWDDLRSALGLAPRAAHVLVTALRSMGLLGEAGGRLCLTELAREHLLPGGDFDVGDYIGLAATSPGVLAMVERLKTDRPHQGDDGGTAFIYRDGIESAMEAEPSARHLTMALAGRAKNVAPALAETVDLRQSRLLLDVGGGTGIYTVALLQKYPRLRAIVLDRPEVLKVARQLATEYAVLDRLQWVAGDMFKQPFPEDVDAILLSNVLHDWDLPECQTLIGRCASALASDGRLFIHDVFLNDSLDGPLPIALYSAALFSLTEGRAYSAAEYRGWLQAAGLQAQQVVPTRVHCGVLEARRMN
jgi:ubiquinone/menaquinone biosynthesis C-methylase UbiE